MMRNNQQKILHNSDGLVSITVTIIFILVISLIIMGFSQVTRRNSREALDRQLSTQAFYAAETGVNDAISEIRKKLENRQVLSDQTECNQGDYTKNNGVIDADDGIKYTCLTVDTEPTGVVGDNLNENPMVFLLETESAMNNIEISWKRTSSVTTNASNMNGCRGMANHYASWNANQCPFGLIRADILPVQGRNPDNSPLEPSQIYSNPIVAAQKTMTLFAYPHRSETSETAYADIFSHGNIYGAGLQARQGVAHNASCSLSDNVCKVRITGLSHTKVYVKISAKYVASDVTIRALDTTVSQEGMPIQNSQVVIDATGKARDVLRRIQVRYNLGAQNGGDDTPPGQYSDFALQSGGSICKRYSIAPAPANAEQHEGPSSGC